jgi:hypothetical protein
MFDHALSSMALGELAGADGYIAAAGASAMPAATSGGIGARTGVGVTGGSTMPAATHGYSYGQAIATDTYLAGSVGVADTSGDIDFVVYPSSTRHGDLAILVVGWQDDPQSFITPDGWELAEIQVPISPPSPNGQAFVRRVDDTEPFPLIARGPRQGGGYMMNVYRNGAYGESNNRASVSNTVVFDPVNVTASGDHVAVFGITTGTQTYIDSGDMTAPYTVVNNMEGDNGAGQASIWSADAEISSAGSHTPSSINPSSYSTINIDWVSFAILINQIGATHRGAGNSDMPMPTHAIAAEVTSKIAGNSDMPFPFTSGVGLVSKSGREVCISDGGGNSVAPFRPNSVRMTPSANQAKILSFNNRLC